MAPFNRFIASLLSLVLLALGVALLTVPGIVLSGAEGGLSALGALPATSLVIGGAALAALGLLLLLLELWPRGRRAFVAPVEGGSVEYRAATVADFVERELRGVEGVRHAKAEVRGRGRTVDIGAHLQLMPDRDPGAVVGEATSRVHDKLGRGLGLTPGQVRVSIEPSAAKRPAEEGRAQPALGARP